MSYRAENPPTMDRLRADIDSGKTAEKVPYPDWAAAPLGTDDEAADRPPTEQERRVEAQSREDVPAPSRRKRRGLWIYVLLIVGVAALVVLAISAIPW
ncbi:hypothetical protein [Brucella sp. IR073]|uniref:hypothetical protein n=1 Tax=unclassified Brucella TaxID=2632610 RepID=UPI003B97DCEA